jgi:hypothetical protein
MLRGGDGTPGSPWEDELLLIDRAVRKGLGVLEGETILATAFRILMAPLSHPKRLAAAHLLVNAHEAHTERWVAMKEAAALLSIDPAPELP